MDTRADHSLTLTYHRAAEKSSSFIEIINPESNDKPIIVEPMYVLGKGAYGIVTKFGQNSTMFAVKKPHKALTVCANTSDIGKAMRELDNEMEFMQTAYPGGTYGMLKFLDSETELDYRLIMPVVNGQKSTQTTDTLTDARTFAYVVLKILTELQRIHDLDLIHGDASPANILIEPNQLTAHFIDGAFSCRVGKKIKVFEIAEPLKSYMPPERVNVKKCRAHHSQDVYTICWTIDYLIKHRKKCHPHFADIDKMFPCIQAFIAKGLNPNPAERPSLKSLIEQLQPLLVMEHIKHQLLSYPTEDPHRILRDYKEQVTVTQLLCLSHELIQLEKYELLQSLLGFIESLTLDQKSEAVGELYRYISTQKTAVDTVWKNSLSLFIPRDDFYKISDQLTGALNLAVALNFTDYTLNADTLNSIKATPTLFKIYNRLIANGAQINMTEPHSKIQHI